MTEAVTGVPHKENEDIIRVAYIPDLHLTLRQSKNRKNIIQESITTLQRITDEVIIPNNIDVVIQLGDLFDRSESNLPTQAWSQMMYEFQRMKDAVNGNMFINIGNHEYTYSRHNPTFLITNLEGDLVREMYLNKDIPNQIDSIFRAPSSIDIHNTTIYFNHFQPNNKKYVAPCKETGTSIGLFHDDIVSYESKDQLFHHNIGKGIDLEFSNVMNNINLAICGHIHIPLTIFQMDNENRTTVITPGSLINRTTAEVHQSVNIPITDIGIDSLKVHFHKYNLPVFKESFLEEVVDENKSKYELAKLMKGNSKIVGNSETFVELMAQIKNEKVKEIIREAEKPIVVKEIGELHDFIDAETRKLGNYR